MKIGLISSENKDKDIEFNIKQIKNYTREAKEKSVDLICFGESFLQGFEGLTWDYERDCEIAKETESETISRIRKIAMESGVAISFGFIERERNTLYSSNLVIGEDGETVDLFRRVSPGWKEPEATENYKEGKGFHSFRYKGKTFAAAICGDLWDDKWLSQMEGIKTDMVFWPLYVDYSIKDWQENNLQDYADRVKDVESPVGLINSYVDMEDRANGGCYVFEAGKVKASLPMGNKGILICSI